MNTDIHLNPTGILSMIYYEYFINLVISVINTYRYTYEW